MPHREHRQVARLWPRSTGRRARIAPLARAHELGDPFGVGAFITQRSSGVAGKTIGRLKLLGVGWVREEFTATRLHAGPRAAYAWSTYDRVIDAERKAGVQVLGLLDYSNTWDLGDHGTMPSSDMRRLDADFARYAYAVARHFRRRIDVWQVWNEPDLQTFWHPAPNPVDYAGLLTAAYRAIKRANPHARVVMAGISRFDLAYLRTVVDHTPNFDIIAIHPYRGEPETQLLGQIREVQRWHRPVWFSEIGWAAGDGCDTCDSETAQAQYLVRFYALALAAGVQRVFWYDLRDDVHTVSPAESHFGLLRLDLSGKPSFAAYATLARSLRQARFLGMSSDPGMGSYLLRFDTRAGPLLIAWNVGSDAVHLTAAWHARDATVYGIDGCTQGEAQVSGSRVAFDVQPDGSPVYVAAQPAAGCISPPGALLHPPPPPPPPRPPRPRISARRVVTTHRAPPVRAQRHRHQVRRPQPRGAWAVGAGTPAQPAPSGGEAPARLRPTPTPSPVPSPTPSVPIATPTIQSTPT